MIIFVLSKAVLFIGYSVYILILEQPIIVTVFLKKFLALSCRRVSDFCFFYTNYLINLITNEFYI